MAKKQFLVIALLLLLSGCETTQSWTQRLSFLVPQPESAIRFDFNWRLSGAREVAPLQVFSSDKQLWLQFASGQNIPAIFALEQQRHTPLSYTYSDPYVIVKGTWRHLVFRGAALKAEARYEAPLVTDTSVNNAVDELVAPSVTVPQTTATTAVVEPAAPALRAEPIALASTVFTAKPEDGTLRQVLKRWAQYGGWLFEDQHWEVEVDLPIASLAQFSPDFDESVVQLMRSTALGARPLQACLYSNKVLRVIPLAQNCDPAAATPNSQG